MAEAGDPRIVDKAWVADNSLVAYDWPGNVRELVNVLERAAILAQGPVIGPAELPDFGRVLDRGDEVAGTANQSEAARRLGMSRATFAYKVEARGL